MKCYYQKNYPGCVCVYCAYIHVTMYVHCIYITCFFGGRIHLWIFADLDQFQRLLNFILGALYVYRDPTSGRTRILYSFAKPFHVLPNNIKEYANHGLINYISNNEECNYTFLFRKKSLRRINLSHDNLVLLLIIAWKIIKRESWHSFGFKVD